MSKFLKKIIILTILLIISAGIIVFLSARNKKETVIKSTPTENLSVNIPNQKILNNINLAQVISTGINTIPENITFKIENKNINLPFISGDNLYKTMLNGQKNNLLNFKGKEYSGLGFFVTDIGDIHQGNGKNIIYYINGKEASVGISSYIPHIGDIIEWKLE